MSVPRRYRRLVLFLTVTAVLADAQLQYRRLSTNDGLAQNFVSSIEQDRKGFLWFGTFDGLSRYDGYSFRNYRTEPADSSSLTSGFITALHVSASGVLWIGFIDGTVNLFDPRTERFRRLSVIPVSLDAEYSRRIVSFAEGPPGTVWIGTAGAGLIRCAESASADGGIAVASFTAVGTPPSAFPVTNIRSLLMEPTGTLWVQTDRSILAVDAEGRSARRIWHRDDGDTLTVVCRSARDSSGGLWFITPRELIRVHGASGRAEVTDLRGFWQGPEGRKSGYMSVSYDVHRDELWATTQFDILRADRKDGRCSRRPVPVSANGLSVLYTQTAIDRGGTVWFGTMGFGAYRYHRKADAFGLIPGLNLGDLNRQICDLPPPNEKALLRFPKQVRAYAGAYSHTDRSGRVWSMARIHQRDYAVRRYDPSGRTSIVFTSGMGPRQVNGPYFPVFLELNDDALWIVNYFYGLDRIDRRTDTVAHYQFIGDTLTAVRKRAPFSVATVTGIADLDGSAWIGTINRGLYHFDPATFTAERYAFSADDTNTIGHDYVTTLCLDPFDPARYLWVGTYGGGLSRMDKTTGTFLRFNERTGLPNNVINAVRPDKRGFLWISTNHGLWRLDPRSLQFRFYDVNDGLQGMEFNRFEAYVAPDGRMFFGGTEGVNVFRPEDVSENTHVPPVVITGLLFRNRSVDHREPGAPMSVSITEAGDVTLRHEDNVVTFEFAALDFVNPGKNAYSYRLEGFDADWSVPSTRRTATYTNLDPGGYRFLVRGSNGDGVWNMEGASLAVTVLPPWWRTWWAYILYVLAAAAALFTLRRYELRQVRLKDQLLLEQARTEQLRGIDEMKMRFFQNISHEFRTPLTLILGPVEKLLARSADETDKRELRMMRRNANRLLRLINQLLDISRLVAGGMMLNPVREDIVSFVRGVTMAFHSLAERKEIFLDMHADEERIVLAFDKDKVEKVLINLIGNAFKFTPENGEVHVRLSRREGWVDIAVRDTGIGIPPEKLGRVFERFYQADMSSTRSHEGTGIGLSLVKELVELHRGTVSVASTPGTGSVFTVSLPLAPVLGTAARVPAPADVPPGIADETGPDETAPAEDAAANESVPLLLIIEDNADVRAYIRSYVVPDYRIVEAFDGEEGIAKAREHVPDLIISDVMMPKKDGYEVCSAVKRDETTSHIPVVLLTARAASEDKISGLETGADDYLVKPFDSAELLARVRNLIESRRRLREKFGREVASLAPEQIAVTPIEQLFLAKVKGVIEERMGDENFGVDQLAAALAMSYTQLHRKLKAIINQPANQFIRSMRLQRAMDILSRRGASVSETAYTVGFSSPAYFSKCFSEHFGLTPTEALEKGKTPLS